MMIDLPPARRIGLENGFLLISVIVACYSLVHLTLLRWEIQPVSKRRRFDLALIGVLISWCFAASWFRTHTGFGLLVLKSARPWMIRAEKSKDPEEAKAILRAIQESSQYGVNAAEDAVRALPDPNERVRMFRLLADCAINDGWRDGYLADAEREEARIKSTP